MIKFTILPFPTLPCQDHITLQVLLTTQCDTLGLVGYMITQLFA